MPRFRFDIEQGTPEWQAARLGMITGTKMHLLLGSGQAKQDAVWELLSERKYMDSDNEDFATFYMERGKILEAEARRLYSAATLTEVKECGLVEDDEEFDGYVACSPDGLLPGNGILEIKCLTAKYHEQYTNPKSPKYEYIRPEYRTQLQFNMMVTGYQWAHYVMYHPRGGMHVIRIEPDPEYQEKIKTALRECIKFIEERL